MSSRCRRDGREAAERHICTAPDQKELDRDYGGGEYTETYKCPRCGKTFEVELPQ